MKMAGAPGRVRLRHRIRRARVYARSVLHELHPRYLLAHTVAHLLPVFSAGPIVARVYRLAGFSIGRGTSIAGPVRVLIGSGSAGNLAIGRDVIISNDVTINLDDEVLIGDRVGIGPFVVIYTSTHPNGPGTRRMGMELVRRPVRIGDGAWVRLGAIVLPGVTIGEGAVVGAGSVVTRDVEPHTFVVGNPAAPVKVLPETDR